MSEQQQAASQGADGNQGQAADSTAQQGAQQQQTTDGQQQQQAADGQQQQQAEGQQQQQQAGPPETYELTLPADAGLDQSDSDYIATLAKSKGWTNEQAQAALNAMGDDLKAQRRAFRDELERHPELGGDKLAKAQEYATRFLDRFLPANTPDGARLRAALNKTGTGDFAPLVLLLSKAGKAMGEDPGLRTFVGGHAPVERKSDAEVFHGASSGQR